MSTVDDRPLSADERSALGDIARRLDPARVRRLPAALSRAWTTARTNVLSVGGFGCLDYAAFELHPVAGWATTGLSLLVLEYLGKERGQRA